MNGGGHPNGVASQEPPAAAAAGRAAMLKQVPTQLRPPQQRPGERTGTGQAAPSDEMAALSLDPSFKKGVTGTRYMYVGVWLLYMCICKKKEKNEKSNLFIVT